jgi:hypothetical protein
VDRRDRAPGEHGVRADQGAVEVARDRGDVAREAVGEDQLVDSTTYAATSAICCSLSWSPKAGIAPAPFVTRSTVSARSG